MEETHARNGGWAHRSAHRSGVVGPKAAPDRPDHQHVIGPPPLAKAPLNAGIQQCINLFIRTCGPRHRNANPGPSIGRDVSDSHSGIVVNVQEAK